jgi:hypothetical protein
MSAARSPSGPAPKRGRTMLLAVNDVRQLLLAEIRKSGTQSEWARRNGVNRSSVSLFLSGQRMLQPKIMRALKLKKITAYAKA